MKTLPAVGNITCHEDVIFNTRWQASTRKEGGNGAYRTGNGERGGEGGEGGGELKRGVALNLLTTHQSR